MNLVSYVERPDLLERRGELGDAWEEFMYHDAVANVHWNRRYEEFPDLQLFLLDEEDRLLAESNAVPIPFGPDGCPTTAGMRRSSRRSPVGRDRRVGDRDHDRRRAARQGPEPDDARRDAEGGRGARALRTRRARPPEPKHDYPLTPMERYVGGAATTASSSTRGCARTSRRVPS